MRDSTVNLAAVLTWGWGEKCCVSRILLVQKRLHCKEQTKTFQVDC